MFYSKKYKGAERRRYPRLSEGNSLVFYKPQTEKIKESFSNNISAGGLCFDALDPIKPGVVLECEIYKFINCQENIITPIFILAKVVWIKEMDAGGELDGNKYRFGLKLLRS